MENNELLAQIATMFEMQTQAITEMVDRKIKDSEARLNTRMDTRMQEMETRINGKMQEMETRINIKLENDVAKRIDSLFDGYKLVHEKQWELEHKIESLEKRLEMLESKAG